MPQFVANVEAVRMTHTDVLVPRHRVKCLPVTAKGKFQWPISIIIAIFPYHHYECTTISIQIPTCPSLQWSLLHNWCGTTSSVSGNADGPTVRPHNAYIQSQTVTSHHMMWRSKFNSCTPCDWIPNSKLTVTANSPVGSVGRRDSPIRPYVWCA